jgi:hypothetical protein
MNDAYFYGFVVGMCVGIEPALPIGTKLYTSPPTRKPLTDSELWEMWVESPSDVLRFARAIERAHGITE